MKTLHTAILAGAAVIGALWWAAMPPRFTPEEGVDIALSRQVQCPEVSSLRGKECTCPAGSGWNGALCERGLSTPGIVSEHLGPAKVASNSLAFARARVPSLPDNLNSWPRKMDAINSAFPLPGSVAMIEVPSGLNSQLGHVAIVEAVGEASLTIIEGNYITGEVTRRTATGKNLADAAQQLRIVGYFKP